MASFENIPVNLYEVAMDLFYNAGHAVTPEPIYCNHSPEQVVYFDSQIDAYLSRQQRAALKATANISHLFDINGDCFNLQTGNSCGFYSIELLGTYSSRSQAAYDAHIALIPFLTGNINVILFRYDGKIMLSMQGFDSDVVLSNWYDEITEIEQLTEQIDISNISLNSSRDYISDFIYSCARGYYIYPVSGEQAAYNMLPLTCFSLINSEILSYNKDELKEMARDALRTAEKEYGIDFVEFGTSNIVSNFDISAELDLLSLEIDMDEELLEESPFEDDNDFDTDDLEDEFGEDEKLDNDEQERDEYEFDDYEDDIFQDPLKMLKFLELNDKRRIKVELPPILQESTSVNSIGTDLISFFEKCDLEVIDKRPKGGCLWVIGDEQTICEHIKSAEKVFGVTGGFAAGKATNGRIGWYTRSNK